MDNESLEALGRLSVADIERYLAWRKSERRQGWVRTAVQGLVRMAVGQRWGYITKDPLPLLPPEPDGILPLTLVSFDVSGEVVLRPADPAMVDRVFPVTETIFKGKTIQTRQCPFYWVEERLAKGSEGKYKPGDLTCNEAWDLWGRMHLHTEGLLVPDI